jgi:nucleoside-diphosphate-sugar epimerase
MKVLVTGGGGFVGGALCRRLRDLGHNVTGLGRRVNSGLTALESEGIRTVIHDLSLLEGVSDLARLFVDVDCVFHAAAHVKMWGPRQEFVRGNIQATNNVIAACRAAGVSKLVFTSSPSVIASDHDLRGVDESVPYPKQYRAYYPETKAVAERAVLSAHSATLRTIALRPHLIFGSGDTNLVPTILNRARAGRLVQVGDGKNLVDLTHIDDCVSAHVLAAAALDERPTAGGRAFFISQGTPVLLWEWIERILILHDAPSVQRQLSASSAQFLATVAESVWKTIRLSSDPPLTRFLVKEMSTDHYFDISAARRELGYIPTCTVWEATEKKVINS